MTAHISPFWDGYIADTKNHEEIIKCVGNHDALVETLEKLIIKLHVYSGIASIRIEIIPYIEQALEQVK